MIGLPSYEYWEYVESILPFLMLEVVEIWNGINHLLKSNGTSSVLHIRWLKTGKKSMANIGVNLTSSICCC